LRLDRDAALLFDIHRVHDLAAHLARLDGVALANQAVCECGFAVVDMRYDAEISDIFCFQVAFPDEILSRIVPKFHLKTGK